MTIIGNFPNTLANGTVIDANPVMQDFQYIKDQVNANAIEASTLAAPTGATLIGYQPLGGGAVTTVANSLRRYFVDGDSFISPSNSRADNNTGWANMVTYINTLSTGAHVMFSRGEYLFENTITMPPNTIITGQGKSNTIFSFNHTSHGLEITSPINSSTAVRTIVEHIQLKCTNGSNTGGGYVDIGGTFVQVTDVLFVDWKYSLIFDQTELADIVNCDFESALAASVWLVNGADFTPGALGGFTNRISIKKCQFNGSPIGIVDDGGTAHVIECNNFNGGVNSIRIAGCLSGLAIRGNEFEGTTDSPIFMTSTTSVLGSNVGPSTMLLEANALSSTNTIPAVRVDASGGSQGVISIANGYGGPGTKISFDTPNGWIYSTGDRLAGGTLSNVANYFNTNDLADQGAFTPVLSFGGASTGITYTTQAGRYKKLGLAVHFSVNIVLTSKGSSTGTARITGLPYANNSGATLSLGAVYCSAMSGVSVPAAFLDTGTSEIKFVDAIDAPVTILTNTNFGNTSSILLSGVYFVA